MALLERVRQTLRQHALARPDTRVLVALSGGADSVALLYLLRQLQASGDLVLAGAAHVHHGLRGADADADEAFCRDLTADMGVAFASERVDVRALARERKRSIEDAARTARYQSLERAAAQFGAAAIATAHTRDDQAETFLLRLLRGAATRGLASIRPRAGRVIRPVIDVARAELRQYLRQAGGSFREDATNRDVAIPRNRVRHELLPLLETRFSPAATVLLARQAGLARDDDELLQRLAIETARHVVLRETDAIVELDAAALTAAPRALSSRIVYQVLTARSGGRSVGADHVDRLLALAAATGHGTASLPGQYAERRGSLLALRPGRGPNAGRPNSFALLLSIPGEVSCQPGGWSIAAQPLRGADTGRSWVARGYEVGVAAGAVALPLTVRTRRAGDRFHPLGAPGARKLQDFLVDRKVPRNQRDRLPLVVDGHDRIVWVAGHSVGEDFRVIDPAAGVLLLTLRRLGGVG